jgi:hypothetical protein
MMLTPEQVTLGRRNFLKALAGAPPLMAFGAAAALRGPLKGGPVRAGFIGPGRQGKVLVGQCPKEFVDLRAVCDINPQNRDEAVDGGLHGHEGHARDRARRGGAALRRRRRPADRRRGEADRHRDDAAHRRRGAGGLRERTAAACIAANEAMDTLLA